MGGMQIYKEVHERGVLKLGNHVIKTWSSTQATVATSSGEAELIAMHAGVAR